MSSSNTVKQVWEAYLNLIGETTQTTQKKYIYWHFGNSEKGANALAELVSIGKKKATASALWVYEHDNEPVPQIGDYSIIVDWAGDPKVIIKTINVEILPFIEVTQEFAAKEGEGDLSLNYWRRVHRDFFDQECSRIGRQYIDNMPVVCEEFELVYQVD